MKRFAECICVSIHDDACVRCAVCARAECILTGIALCDGEIVSAMRISV